MQVEPLHALLKAERFWSSQSPIDINETAGNEVCQNQDGHLESLPRCFRFRRLVDLVEDRRNQ